MHLAAAGEGFGGVCFSLFLGFFYLFFQMVSWMGSGTALCQSLKIFFLSKCSGHNYHCIAKIVKKTHRMLKILL